MTIRAETKFDHYEILAPLGAGGMGEVWRARDTRLNRAVAIKVLPASVTLDADRLRRFEQEALATSALNHPNILTARFRQLRRRTVPRGRIAGRRGTARPIG